MGISKVVLLNKDPQGDGIRPILLVPVWRKVINSVLLQAMQNDMAPTMADVQFGHLSNGCAQFATYVDGCRRCHPDFALLQLDMASAFGT
eukprot:2443277-Amphidinium_carterae.1